MSSSSRSPPRFVYTATLTPPDVRALTTRAGVRKSFAAFAAMTYDALTGRTASVSCHVETAAQMQRRVARHATSGDTRRHEEQQQQQQQRLQQQRRHAARTQNVQEGNNNNDDNNDDEKSSCTANARRHATPRQHDTGDDTGDDDNATTRSGSSRGSNSGSDDGGSDDGGSNDDDDGAVTAAAAAPLLFVTVDYDVDYTRALFPIALTRRRQRRRTSDAYATRTTATMTTTKATREHARRGDDGHGSGSDNNSSVADTHMSKTTESTVAFASPTHDNNDNDNDDDKNDHDDDDSDVYALRRTVQRLRAENAKLRSANDALSRLSREKMLQMQRLCDDFQSRVRDAAEVARLRRRNGELRAQLRDTEAARDAAVAAVATLQRQQPYARNYPNHSHYYNHYSSMSYGSNGSSRKSNGAAQRATTPAAAAAAAAARRAAAVRTPTPRYDSARGGNGGRGSAPRRATATRTTSAAAAARPSRFDTPPRARGRRGVRCTPRYRDDDRASCTSSAQEAAPRRRTASSSSSRASSTLSASHERLYRAQTASSRHRELLRRAAWQALDTPPPRRAVFYYLFRRPGRKALDEVCKLHLLEAATPQQVTSIWNAHHVQFLQYWGRVISADAYYALEPRLRRCPYFVVPCFREKGLFNAVTNFTDDLVGVAPLAEWQRKQDDTQVHMTVQFFTELARSKRVVLVRCEIKDEVFVRTDCIFVTQMLLRYYTLPHLYETYVETFNKRPGHFDYHAYLRAMKDEAHKDNVRIDDKKLASRSDAYGPVIDTPPDEVARQLIATMHTGAASV